jgi:hypothetical protein
MFKLNLKPAGLFRGAPLNDTDFHPISMGMFGPIDWKQRVKKFGGRVLLSGSINELRYEDFGRFLAKIAHSYAVATFGIGSFIPFLTKAIRNEHPMYLSHFVGGQIAPGSPDPTNHLHVLHPIEAEFPTGEKLLVVRIRLFAVDNLMLYDVVVGQATAATTWPRGSR